MLEARGEYEAAAERVSRPASAIVRRFAAADPGNAGSQRDLAVSHAKLAANYHRLGKVGQALAELRAGARHHGGAGAAAPRGRAMERRARPLRGPDRGAAGPRPAAGERVRERGDLASAADKLLLLEPKPPLPPVVTVKLGD